MIDAHLTESYLGRVVDSRMVSVIRKYLTAHKTILDLGCGSGLYGKYLKQYGAKVVGFDYDPVLCEQSQKSGDYDRVICADVMALDDKVEKVDAIFCSEFLEHMSNENLERVVLKMESITRCRIVITVPNPLSPHFKYDSSHILKYSIYSFLTTLNKSRKFQYKLYSIGFSETNLKKWYFRFLNVISGRISLFSPTVLYVGSIRP